MNSEYFSFYYWELTHTFCRSDVYNNNILIRKHLIIVLLFRINFYNYEKKIPVVFLYILSFFK